MTKIIFSKNEIQDIIFLRMCGLSMHKIGIKYGRDDSVIDRILKENGITFRMTTNTPKASLRGDAFSDISDKDSAYWAGLIAADGCVRLPKNCVTKQLSIMLSARDLNHLKKFADFISFEKEIKFTKRSEARIRFCHGQITNDLIGNWNIVPNKTEKMIPPDIPQESISSFVRGYFDGDGCIHIDKRYRAQIIIVAHTDRIINWIADNAPIKSNVGIDLSPAKYGWNAQYRFFISKQNEVKKFMEWIYKDSIEGTRLERKWKVWNEFKSEKWPTQ